MSLVLGGDYLTLPISTPTFAFSNISSTLPTNSGLAINPDGSITGNPLIDGDYSFTADVYDNSNSLAVGTKTFAISIPYSLPVSIIKPLSAAVVNGNVNLNWTTGLEINNKLFDIQRSSDAKGNWTSIGTVPSFFASGSGNGHTYTFNDPNPFAGNNYYRLVQQDIDGHLNIDPYIVQVQASGRNIFSFTPNPAINGAVNLRISGANSGIYNIQIVNINGQIIYTKLLTLNSSGDNIPLTPNIKNKGMYFYRLVDALGSVVYSQNILIK